MAEGRTTYHPKDDAWWRREHIVILADEFGPAGPAVIDWLECEASAQRDGGRVRAGMNAISRGTSINDLTLVHRIVTRARELEALEEFDEERHSRFSARVSGMEKDRERAGAADRKARQRNRQTMSVVTPSHGRSRSVTVSHGQSQHSADTDGAPSELTESDRETVEGANNAGDDPETGAPENTGDPSALSRFVTVGHGESRDVTECHVKTKPLLTSIPPQPPASGGRQRDRDRLLKDYTASIATFTAEHPCAPQHELVETWQAFVSNGAPTLLVDSHPHQADDPDVLLIGVHPGSWFDSARDRFPPHSFDRITAGKAVHFVPCPHLQKERAA